MTTIQDALTIAVDEHRAGRLDVAEMIYRRVLAVTPQLDALRLLGLIVVRRDPAAALRLARIGLALDPVAAVLLDHAATLLHGMGRSAEAEALLHRVLRLQPDHVDALLGLGRIHQAANAYRLAEAAFRGALFLRHDLAEAHLGRALAALGEDDPDAALPRLGALLAVDPALSAGLYNAGLARQMQGCFAEAERLYRRLLGAFPSHVRGLTMLARLRLLAGDIAEAERLYRRVPADQADTGEVRSGLERCAQYRAAAMAADPGSPAGSTPGLVVRGPFRDTSGYAWMVRRFVHGLTAQGVDIHLIDLGVDFVPTMAEGQRSALHEGLCRPVRARSLLTFSIPSVVEAVPPLRTVNFSMFEARTVSRQWARYSAALPHIIVPTESSRTAWVEAGFPAERLHLCPLGVDPAPEVGTTALQVIDAAGRRLSDYRTRILNVSDLLDRKNLDGLLRVWLRTSRAEDGAALILKLGKGLPERDRRAWVFIEAVARSVGRPLDRAGPIFLSQGILSDSEMACLFAGCTHYWSMSHGEGWDLPMAQAGAMGLRLIAPRHTAYTAYLDDSIATLLPVSVAPASPPYRGLEWWNPDEDAAADALLRAIAGTDAPQRDPRDRLLGEFGWPQATARLRAVLQDIGAL
jgi:tetratricopeptide (TPR) repeat protein